MVDMKKKIIIIGAGLGGLSAGCRLAAAGHTVEILEQRAELGGLAASMRIGDYAIDTGPSAITSPEAIENIFLAAGKPLPESLQWLPIAPAYRVFNHDMRSFNFKFDAQFLVEEVQRWDANETAACNEYLKNIRPFFSPKFQDRSNLPFLNPFSMLKTIPAMIRLRWDAKRLPICQPIFQRPLPARRPVTQTLPDGQQPDGRQHLHRPAHANAGQLHDVRRRRHWQHHHPSGRTL